MNQDNDNNTVRTILRSEITWLISFIVIIMGFVSTVVLPIQKLQLQLTQVQMDLAIQNNNYDKVEDRVSTLEKAYARLSR